METTRRKILSGCIAAILAAKYSQAHITKSIIGATNINFEDTDPDYSDATAADYVQEGLIAHWDGIENAGYGIHDPLATTWVDLSGNFPSVIGVGECRWTGLSLLNDSDTPFSYEGRIREFTYKWLHDNGIFGDIESYKSTFIGEYMNEMVYAIPSDITGGYCGFKFYKSNAGFDYSIGYPWNSKRVIFGPANNYANQSAGGYHGYILNDNPNPVSYSGSASASQLSASNLYANFNFVYQSTSRSFTQIDDRYNSGLFIVPHGEVFCIRIYNRVLTDEERMKNYLIDKARFGLKWDT